MTVEPFVDFPEGKQNAKNGCFQGLVPSSVNCYSFESTSDVSWSFCSEVSLWDWYVARSDLFKPVFCCNSYCSLSFIRVWIPIDLNSTGNENTGGLNLPDYSRKNCKFNTNIRDKISSIFCSNIIKQPCCDSFSSISTCQGSFYMYNINIILIFWIISFHKGS